MRAELLWILKCMRRLWGEGGRWGDYNMTWLTSQRGSWKIVICCVDTAWSHRCSISSVKSKNIWIIYTDFFIWVQQRDKYHNSMICISTEVTHNPLCVCPHQYLFLHQYSSLLLTSRAVNLEWSVEMECELWTSHNPYWDKVQANCLHKRLSHTEEWHYMSPD